MQNIRKFSAVLLVFILMFTLCSCGSNSEPEIEEVVEYEYVSGTDQSGSGDENAANQGTTGNNSKNQTGNQGTTGNNSKNQTGNQGTNQTGNNSKNQTGNNTNTNQNSNVNNSGSNKVEKTKTIKVLAIGNSYSNNATKYLARIADSTDGDTTIFAASLYFPGCSIEKHNFNISYWNTYFNNNNGDVKKANELSKQGGTSYYWLEVGGKQVGITSLYDAIRYDDWDYITIQQTPDGCDNFDTYWTKANPHLIKLYDYIQAEYQRDDMKGKKCPPILIHQTWAFNGDMAVNNAYPNYPVNYASNTEMFKKVEEAYNLAALKLKELRSVNVPIIPAGKAIQVAQDKYGYSRKADANNAANTLYMDEISHLNDRGSYLAACVWAESLAKIAGTTINTSTSTFVPNITGMTKEDCQGLQYIAREVVHGK